MAEEVRKYQEEGVSLPRSIETEEHCPRVSLRRKRVIGRTVEESWGGGWSGGCRGPSGKGRGASGQPLNAE